MAANKKKTINLLPKDDFESSTIGRLLKWALTSFRFIVIVVELVVIVGFLSRFWLDVQNNDLIDEIDQKTALISSKLFFEKEFRHTQQKLGIYSTITAAENKSFPYLSSIAARLPTGTRLLRYHKSGDQIDVKASTLIENAIPSYLNGLAQVKEFSSVNLRLLETPQNSPIIEFTLSIKLKTSIAGISEIDN
ncbi:hypothetical protein C4564_03395 [Candidatus Microgenomates bacterium]|nr:MAG: hypothetical protein C4564_03395 [Candidatus Microgenomates bacterium]